MQQTLLVKALSFIAVWIIFCCSKIIKPEKAYI